MKYLLIPFRLPIIWPLSCLLLATACDDDDGFNPPPQDLANIWQAYDQLPEAITAATEDSAWLATYILPTDRYGHAILGDGIEAGGLVLYHDGQYVEFVLPQDAVFEDLAPRLVDINTDGTPELLCIRSGLQTGAGLAIYQLQQGELIEYAHTAPIGWANSWLNVAALTDLDQDGQLDLFWVQTPHVGGILKAATVGPGLMEVTDQYRGPSNHALDERNLCLSAVVAVDDQLQIALPSQARDSVLYFSYNAGHLTRERAIPLAVDFSLPLYQQLPSAEWLSDNNCLRDW